MAIYSKQEEYELKCHEVKNSRDNDFGGQISGLVPHVLQELEYLEPLHF
jgi:hypothetical protein